MRTCKSPTCDRVLSLLSEPVDHGFAAAPRYGSAGRTTRDEDLYVSVIEQGVSRQQDPKCQARTLELSSSRARAGRPRDMLPRLMLVFCAACSGAAVVPRLYLARTPLTLRPTRRGTVAMGFESSIIAPLNEWLTSAPYASAFCVTAFKASSADQIAQARERRLYATGVMNRRQQQQLSRAAAAATDASLRSEATAIAVVCDELSCEEVEVVRELLPTITCDDISCEEVAVPAWRPSRPAIVWPRTLAFLFYGGLYQVTLTH